MADFLGSLHSFCMTASPKSVVIYCRDLKLSLVSRTSYCSLAHLHACIQLFCHLCSADSREDLADGCRDCLV